ncbi:hypothetical protein BU23DRAFT_542456 [Bimuria novae-zelandiae CBS 107.79]|uniref:DUF6594 domain-containing protein n=1 Tax=Bimuria novae-zelandiae CBS 107.79 TaxID=1447943 RepID=A0A6A5UUW8_9PLEO|nr:hypothetical protein BU23DRAFT_542456 [Bimuria novae-zelandiae CBS 107.79]
MKSTKPPTKKVRGYPQFASKIELRPEFAIFRRFGGLNAENLLYLQAELSMLEEDLQLQQKIDSESNHERRSKYALNWYQLSRSRSHGDTTQLDLVFRIRDTLKQYNDALIQQAQILRYPPPSQKDLGYVQNFLDVDLKYALSGADAEIWGCPSRRTNYSPDLITLCPRPKEDPFSNWAVEKTIVWLLRCGCARFMKPSPLHGVIGYEDTKVLKITYWMTSIVASLIPISSIVILYTVHSMPARLGIIAGFNVLISICLSGLTSAKRAEVFAVTAAFAAVQVVFVSADKS